MSKTKSLPTPLKQLLVKGKEELHPGVSVDCVIFGFHDNTLKILLLQLESVKKWSLPGGFVLHQENIDDAAYRVLHLRTGLENIFLQQFNVFGKARRTDPSVHITKFQEYGIKLPKDNWLIQRFITVGYYALIDYTAVSIKQDSYDTKFTWMDVAKIDNLIMDHKQIVEKALETLRIQLAYLPIGKNLLPKKFTMPELQKLYETILNKPLDRRNFQRKIIGFGILNKLSETRKGGAHKAPFLYTFNDKKYQKALREGLYGSW